MFSVICASNDAFIVVTVSAVKAASTQLCTLAASRLDQFVKLDRSEVSKLWVP